MDKEELEQMVEMATIDLRNDKMRLAKAYEELKELDRMKTDFVSITAHELGTPLAIMRNNVEMLLDGTFGDLEDDQRESLSMIINNIERLIKLVQDVRDMSAIYGGRLRLDSEPTFIPELVRGIVDDLKSLAKTREHELELSISSDVSDFVCDRDRVTQVLNNLIHNAIKFTPKGGKIVVSVQKDESNSQNLLFKVEDNGIGISAEEQEKIFDHFYEGDTYLHHETGGSGLGLSIAKGIVEAHGGKIWVESTPEVGSKFYFTIPGGNK
ncbi:MAG: multi-sensor signal transduction histidine kinase [Candidatus Syntrophoarchaeum caldarius]|uniref:histidine kinase n=1 Tax=Candidatus Syntropharchaeum caldarium TaxID=1838285 RepID=A0A1F2PB69_9EURY|nr:MAG: multi-sensor signal transduction histidine kinase [Candidatus Syntrophoarchaeum caldarius]